MFLNLAHTSLIIYTTSQAFVKEAYKVSKLLPADERFNMVQQLRRASLSVHLNISEGCSRKSEIERKRFYEIARGSIIEVDGILDIAQDLDYVIKENCERLGDLMLQVFKMLSKMITAEKSN